jgi:signal transduction histidine kinase
MRKYPFIFITLFFLILLICYELYQGYNHFETNMLYKARQVGEVTKSFRKWNARSGTVYASTEFVKPNEFLPEEGREITYNGKVYTRINPAYMTRMAGEILAEKENIYIKITSTKLTNPLNAPKDWEKRALREIKKGKSDFHEIKFNSVQDIKFRYMTPLVMEKSCKNCHDYGNGEYLRGGISITMPITSVHNQNLLITVMTITVYILSASFIVFFILFFRKKLDKAIVRRDETIVQLEKEIKRRMTAESVLVQQTRSATMNEILSLVAHHWRQPLNNLGLLVQEFDDIKDKDAVRANINESMKLILDMSSTIDLFSSAVKSSDVKPLDFKKMFFDVLKLLKPEFDSVGISIKINCFMTSLPKKNIENTVDENISYICGNDKIKCDMKCGIQNIVVEGAESNFKQIILISQPKSKNRQINITFTTYSDEIIFSINDSGPEISPENKKKLFEPYFSTKDLKSGRGLGLFMAKTLVESFDGGNIYFDDSLEKTFVFKMKYTLKN